MNFSYKFASVKGVQAGHEHYISMVPLKLLSKLFQRDDTDFILPEYRAQRKLNDARVPDITKYILENRTNYVFSALTASIDGEFIFIESEISKDIGILEIDMDSIFLINDGQHRKAAIELAMLKDPSLGEESISIVFFRDKGLEKSQQMFTDLNKHAVKTSNSLSTLYDSKDSMAVLTKKIIENNEILKRYTDKERDNLGKNSSKLFTLANIYKANLKILSGTKDVEDSYEFLNLYWKNIFGNITEWQEVYNGQLTKKSLREDYILTLGIVILAFGKLGSYFYKNREVSFDILMKLNDIDWTRANMNDWENRTLTPKSKVLASEVSINLTCSKIKELLGIPLSKEESSKESKLKEKKYAE